MLHIHVTTTESIIVKGLTLKKLFVDLALQGKIVQVILENAKKSQNVSNGNSKEEQR